MSEPVHVNPTARERAAQEGRNVDPYRIELPPQIVTAQMVPHHYAAENGALVKTGKLEVRIVNPITKDDAKKTVDWQKTAMNCAHQTAYYKQVYDNVVMRAEEFERKYSNAARDNENLKRENTNLNRNAAQDKPIVDAAFSLRQWWGYFLLPSAVKRAIRPV